MQKYIYPIILFLGLSAFVSCQKESINVLSVILNTTSITMTEGESMEILATVSPKDAENKKVLWTTSNSSVAIVNEGMVTAIKEGHASITATSDDGGKTATCSVDVKAKFISVTGVSLDQSELNLMEGDEYILVATVLPDNASNKKITWNSDNNSVATVKDGKVTAIEPGSATITVKTEDGTKTAICKVTVSAKDYSSEPFSITSSGIISIAIQKNGSPASIILEYRKGNDEWTPYSVGDYVDLYDSETVQFRAGEGGNASFSNSYNDYYSIITYSTGTIEVSGNIMSLVDNTLIRTSLTEYEFALFFSDCHKKLTSAANLILPANSLAESCYYCMFEGCTNLVNAPKLPATQLADFCYCNMFHDCTSLINAPELPATTLKNNCYSHIFDGCTSLVNAPELPAISLNKCCYQGMFSGCTSLVNAPDLPATSLDEYCYNYMFSDCINLAMAPELPATSLKNYCYNYMFNGCTDLINAPELPATSLDQGCYQGMFSDCISLINSPKLPATTLFSYCYQEMFAGCKGLVEGPELPATSLAVFCYSGMFSNCTSLTNAPNLLATDLNLGCYNGMFHGCSCLQYVKMMANTISYVSCTSWLDGVSSTGTFVKSKDASWDENGVIPVGWIVKTE